MAASLGQMMNDASCLHREGGDNPTELLLPMRLTISRTEPRFIGYRRVRTSTCRSAFDLGEFLGLALGAMEVTRALSLVISVSLCPDFASDYVKHYDSTWEDLVRQDRFPLQEYAGRSVLTTWTISYVQVQSQSEAAVSLLKVWGFLGCGDLEYQNNPSLSTRSCANVEKCWVVKASTSRRILRLRSRVWCRTLRPVHRRSTFFNQLLVFLV